MSESGHIASAEQAKRVLLVCSPGGHLLTMLGLEPAWRGYDCTWVTLESADVAHLLDGHRVEVGYGPTNRSGRNFVRNLAFAWRTVRRYRPAAILSTGAAPAVPFFIVGKLLRVRLVYVECLARVDTLSLSARMIYPLADEIFAQWPNAASRARAVRYEGSVL